MKRNIIINSKMLRNTRKEIGLKQEDMANNLGVTRKTYIRYESERVCLSKDVVMKIADILIVDCETLVLMDIEKEIERIMNYPTNKFKERLGMQ